MILYAVLERGDFIHKKLLHRLLTVLLVVLVLADPIIVSAKNCYRYAKTTVNVRASPNTKSKVVGRVYWNDKVKIIRKHNSQWYAVQYKGIKRYICAEYLKKNKSEYKTYRPPTSKTFKSYEDADCITDSTSLPQGKLKPQYHLDDQSGVWMIGNRYCIAVGSYYTNSIGTKIDLVLSNDGDSHILKCIAADSKADKDTIKNHRVHKDGSVVEFVVKTGYLSEKVRHMGDVSYTGGRFSGKVEEIRVYK